jgi:ABC-type lipoprotein export system ATPase subunit
MILANNLCKKFRPDLPYVINHINLRIDDGEFISLVGRSGSGKSTLLYLLSTLDRKFEGEVSYDHQQIQRMDAQKIHQLRNNEIGFVFQFHYLINELSALENILLPARKARRYEEKKSQALELLKFMGLEGKEDRLPHKLSGGEQQRVAIARALIMRPKYIFADEPTGNLDTHNGEAIMHLFKEFNQKYGTTFIYVTHDRQFASLARRQIELVDGEIMKDQLL